jgi:hypothetical protein
MKALTCILTLTILACLVCLVAGMASADPADGLVISGYMQNRLYGEPANAHFTAERLSLMAKKEVDTGIDAFVELYYHHWLPSSRVSMDSGYVNFTDKNGNQLRIGKGRNYCFGICPVPANRKTSEYGLVAETFTQDRIVGAQYLGSSSDKKVEYGVAVFNSVPPGTRFSGSDQAYFRNGINYVVPHLADKGEGGNLAGSARVAFPVAETGKVGVSYRTGKLRPSEISSLIGNDLVPLGTTDDTNNRLGADFNYKHPSGMVAQAEYFKAKASTLDFDAWDVLLGYEPPDDPLGVKFYARYGQLDLDPPAVTANSFTWDQKQLLLSVTKPLRAKKPVWVTLEWLRNAEDAPSSSLEKDNDVLFLELFTAF